jgi:predicted nucleotidyltransferase
MGMNEPDLGTQASHAGLAGALFSKVQQKVLALIFMHPDRSFYMRQIVSALHSGTGAVERELAKLERSGLASVEKIGNQKHYRANRSAPIFEELQSLLRKTVGLHDPLRAALAPFSDRIKVAFVYGSIAKGKDTARSDIDVMVIGDDLTYSDIFAGIQEAEKTLARPINPNIMDIAAWKKRQSGKNHFVSTIVNAPKIFIVGSEKDLTSERLPREPGPNRKAQG